MRLSTSTLLLALSSLAAAAFIPHDALCVDSCVEALSYPSFKDSGFVDYYKNLCESDLRFESYTYCAKLYCSPTEIAAGFDYLNQYCHTWASVGTPSYTEPNVSKTELRQQSYVDQEKYWDGLTTLNKPVLPDPEYYHLTFRTVEAFDGQLRLHYRYGWAMYVFWGAVVFISMGFKVLGVLTRTTSGANKDVEGAQPTPNTALGRLKLKLNYLLLTPAAFGSRSVEPYGWCTVPPLLQTATIGVFVIINVVLCAVSYSAFEGNTYWDNPAVQIWRYIADRTGIICFANMPLMWIFGVRNNVLLWITGWSPSTFNQFHRWVARVATLEAVIHSIAYTAFSFLTGGYADYKDEWTYLYWRVGIFGTVLMCFILILSVYYLRQKAYDLFLIAHIVFGVAFLVMMFYHVAIFVQGEYNGYLWACVAIWVFDRAMRLGRLVVLNFNRFTKSKMATATFLQESNLIRVDVPVALSSAAKHGSFYFVYVLHGWTWFQSHPFTSSYAYVDADGVTTVDNPNTVALNSNTKEAMTFDETSYYASSSDDHGKAIDFSRIRFHIRPFSGFTAKFRDMLIANEKRGPQKMRVLVEGPYGLQDCLHHFDNVMFVIGGSGLTVALQHLQTLIARKEAGHAVPRVHLLWAIRQTNLLVDFRREMKMYERHLGAQITIHATGGRQFSVVSTDEANPDGGFEIAGWRVLRGRPNLLTAVENERRKVTGSLAVLACSPPSMTDDTRFAAVQAMRNTQLDIKYIQESFSW